MRARPRAGLSSLVASTSSDLSGCAKNKIEARAGKGDRGAGGVEGGLGKLGRPHPVRTRAGRLGRSACRGGRTRRPLGVLWAPGHPPSS